MAATEAVCTVSLLLLSTLLCLALGAITTIDETTQFPARLKPYLHLINHTHFERAHSEPVLRSEWRLWKHTHNKKYSTVRRELERFAVWKSNKVYIDYHNQFQNVFGYKLAMNQFGDLVSCAVVYESLSVI